MSKVFVLSDNFVLASYLIKTVGDNERILNGRDMDLYTSPGSLSEDFVELGASEIDLKQRPQIEMIKSNYSLCLSIHSKQIFPSEIVNSMSCYNLHPGYNPYNRGWFPHIFSIVNGLPAGATLHLMTDKIDSGPIVDQVEVKVQENDTSSKLYKRVLEVEKNLISKNLPALLSGSAMLHEAGFEGNYNSKKDFEKLKRLELSNQDSLEEHIRLLRALSHEPYENAIYEKNGVRYCLSISVNVL